jgi:NTP pyrophosphatase (non-canonical NTP hydrolase)
MTFEEYQKIAKTTAQYPKIGESYIYPCLGLAGESGELLNKIKKIFRDDGGSLTDSRIEEIKNELGDLLWYLSQISEELNLSLEDIAESNINKLKSRKVRRTIQGDGDNR